MGNLLRRHVIVCGAGVHGTRLVEMLAREHDVVLVDLDPLSLGMRSPLSTFEWRLVGDAVRDETLLDAGVRRAHWVVAVTGDDFANTQIVSAMQGLAAAGRVSRGVRVFVQVEDPSIARFLEEQERDGGRAGAMFVSPFSANSIAAESLIDAAPVKSGGTLLEIGDGRAPNLLLAGDHQLLDALLLVALRRWRVGALRDLESGGKQTRPPMHVSVFGPDAVDRVEELRARWQPEAHLLAIEAKDSEPPGEISADVEEWLRARHRADHAIVVCNEELAGVGLSLRISRALGNGVLMTRVTTQLESVLDQHLQTRTRESEELATTDVQSIADLACDPERMKLLAPRAQLLLALHSEPASVEASELVTALFKRRRALRIRSDSTWRIVPAEREMLEALADPVPLSAIVRAGLRIDLATPTNLRYVAERLTGHEAVAAWCEYARHVTAHSPDEVRKGLSEPAGDVVADRILALRAATLGDAAAVQALSPDGSELAGAKRVAIFAGPGGSATPTQMSALVALLRPALRGYDGVALSGGTAVGIPGAVAGAAREHGVPIIGFTPPGRGDHDLYPRIIETPDELYAAPHTQSPEFSIREPLAMWTAILRAGIAAHDVTVVVFRGGAITTEELLLARALGAQVAWLDPTGAEADELADVLPLGDGGILELPADPMTIRAFIASTRLDGDEADLRESVARYLHNDYRRKQRGRKAPGDPALAPWDQLLGLLKDSNRAAADDIPSKLALVGKRLVRGGPAWDPSDEEVEMLAEAEHGRWNVERLGAGWELGERQVVRAATPDLLAWSELSDEKRQWDRESVRNIPPALADAGWGVAPL
jgi:hypothetical protein